MPLLKGAQFDTTIVGAVWPRGSATAWKCSKTGHHLVVMAPNDDALEEVMNARFDGALFGVDRAKFKRAQLGSAPNEPIAPVQAR